MNIPAPDNSFINPPATVFVTGGTGFVGAYVIRDLLSQGFRVTALRRKNVVPRFVDAALMQRVNWVEGDIMDTVLLEEMAKEADAVVHSAAVVSYNSADRHRLFSTNIEGTANVVNAAIEAGVGRFVHVSSVAAIGKANDGSMVTETNKWPGDKNQTNYGISKHHSEMEVWRGIAEGLNAVIVNPSLILGYGDWNTSSCAIFRTVYNNFGWYTNGVTGFVDVEDVSKAIVLLLRSDIRGERFIVNADNWNYRDLLNTMATAFGKKPPSKEVTRGLGALAWRLESARSFVTGKKKLMTRETVQAALSTNRYDNTRLLNALPGFRYTDLRETIARACVKYLENADTN